MNIARIACIPALLLTAASASAEQALYLRQPTLSPDRTEIAFSYKGDIWKVASAGGRAVRLTVHPERDQRPVWSPNGKNLAFASQREGQSDIYIMPAEGGPAHRLTFNTGNDYPCDWSPNGAWILAETDRVNRPDLEEVPVAGGASRPVTGVPEESEYFARYDSSGKGIVYCDGSGATRWWWEGAKSGASGQVWVLEHPSWPPTTRRVTPEGVQFLWPAFSGADVVATSNASSVANIVRFVGGQGAAQPITEFVTSGVSWLSVSRDGSRAVFERNFRLWQIDLSTDSVWEVVVEAPSDMVELPRVEESVDGKIESFTLSKDGRKLAFVASGEVYHMAAEKPKRAVRLTRTDARERFAQFSKDGQRVIYVSDRTGRQNLYSVDTRSAEEKALTQFEKVDVAKPQVSPADGRIVFYLANDVIASVDEQGGDVDTLLLGRYLDFPIESTQEFRLSPDGKYLAFSALGADFNTDVWVHSLDGKQTENMTRRSRDNHDARWSADGKWLTFQYGFNDQEQVYALRLLPKPPEFAETQLDSLYEASEKSEKKKDTTKTDSLPEVKIDFELAHTRWQRIYPLAAQQGELVATPDGKFWLMVIQLPAGTNIWKVAIDPESEDKPLQLTTGSSAKSDLQVDGKSKWVYYLQEGKLGRVGLDGKDQELFSFAADYDYHPAERRKQKLTECWRMLSSYYYDADMHGAAWDSLHGAFQEILPHVAIEDEWRELGRTFLGNLNSSHLDLHGGRPTLPSARQSGHLGLQFDPVELREGQYVVSRVLPGGPVDLAGDAVGAGSQLSRVNGAALDSGTSLDELLAGSIGKRLRLEFKGGEGDVTVDVKPVTAGNEADLLYENWVVGRRRLVDSISNGRLGYLHIRSMNQTGLDRFQRELTDQSADYEGLVVDVRFNGGGWISVHVLAMLEREPFLLRNFRGSQPTSESKLRSYALEKPSIMLMNHYSFSNAEIFAEGWRRLGLGKIVGYPTGAAVIGTADYKLIDGSFCRRPSTGAFTLDLENLEGNPRQPDIKVFNTQADWLSGRDPQLETAVAELLTELR